MKDIKPMDGEGLAELVLSTMEGFLLCPENVQHSEDYLTSARHIITEFSSFCRTEPGSNPWQMRQHYLARRGELRAQKPFSAGYLQAHKKELSHLLRWYTAWQDRHSKSGELSAESLDAYWGTREGCPPYRNQLVKMHLPCLLSFVRNLPAQSSSMDMDSLLAEYFERRRMAMRGAGYGMVMRHRAKVVTHRHLVWLERQGHLPLGTARAWAGSESVAPKGESEAEKLMSLFEAKLDPSLPDGLRRPLLDYIKYLVDQGKLVKKSIRKILRTSRQLCRRLDEQGIDSFANLRIKHIDDAVSSMVTAPSPDMLRRRRQVQALNSQLRGFLRYLHQRGLVKRDLSALLISPPCYRASRPAEALSEGQLCTLLSSVDRSSAQGRRTYALLMLMATYALRPVDISCLKLDDLRWRSERIAITQSKTGIPLSLPLLGEVAEALYDYLRHDRPIHVVQRHVFLSLNWPHRSLRPDDIAQLAREAMRSTGLEKASARHLRASVATHLLRQGEPLSTIQEILGHHIPDTTRRYAVTDPVLLRQVLDEEER